MDGGVGDGQRRGVGVVPAGLYRFELAFLGDWWVPGGGGIGDILYQRQDRCDGVARGHDDGSRSIGPPCDSHYFDGV